MNNGEVDCENRIIYLELCQASKETGVHHLTISQIARKIREWVEDGARSGVIEIKDIDKWKKQWKTTWLADFPDDYPNKSKG